MEKIKELQAKRAKIVAGLSNSNISDNIKKTMQEALSTIDEEIGKLEGAKPISGDTETFDKLKKVFTSLKQNEKGFYIPSSANDDKYIINKAKEQGIVIKVVDRVNDLTDLYDVYIEYVKDVAPKKETPQHQVYSKSMANFKKYLSLSKKEESLKKQLKTVSSGSKFDMSKQYEIEEKIKKIIDELDFYYERFSKSEQEKYEETFGVQYESYEENTKLIPKFKVGDFVSYEVGDMPVTRAEGKIIEIKDFGNEIAYRIDAYFKNEDGNWMFDSSKYNEVYEVTLKPSSEAKFLVSKTIFESKKNNNSKKQYFVLQNQEGNFYSRSLKGNSLWLDNVELAYPYEKEDANNMLSFAKKEFPKMEIQIITLEDAKKPASPKSSIAKKIKEGVYEIDGVTYDLTKEVFYDKHPIGIVDPNGSQFVSVVKDYFRQKENLEKLVSFVLNAFSAKEIFAKIKAAFKENLPDNSFRDMLIDDLGPASFFFFIKLPKIKKIIIKEFDLDSDQLEIFMDLEYKDEKFEKLQNKLVETIIENFTSKSQYAAMKSKELDSVKKRVYEQIMNTPMPGSDSQNFHLHYFNANSDFYVKEVDYGTNQQDYGFVVLNGDLQNAEYGYTSIAELLKNNFELDLYFSTIDAKKFVSELKDKEEEIEVEEEDEDNMIRFYFKNSEGRKKTEAGEKLLEALKQNGADLTEIGFNWLEGEFTLPNKNKVKFAILDNYGEFKNDFEVKPGEISRTISRVYFTEDDGSIRTVDEIIKETINDFKELIEEHYGAAPSNDPKFTKYKGKEIMYVPVDDTYWLEDVEFETLDAAKEFIDGVKINVPAPAKKDKQPEPSDNLIGELVRKATAQILFNYGTCTEILDIDEEVLEQQNQLEVIFDLKKKDVKATRTVILSLDTKEILSKNFAFVLPESTNVNQFLKSSIGDLDKRSQNQVYSFGAFLRDHSEEIIGKKVASKTIKNVSEEEKSKLKAAYTKKVKEKSPASPKQKVGKVTLTKELIRHGVTQDMVDKVNQTGEGIVLKAVSRTSTGSKADKARQAMKPGKRLSADGNIYYEYRRNMSDSGNKGL